MIIIIIFIKIYKIIESYDNKYMYIYIVKNKQNMYVKNMKYQNFISNVIKMEIIYNINIFRIVKLIFMEK